MKRFLAVLALTLLWTNTESRAQAQCDCATHTYSLAAAAPVVEMDVWCSYVESGNPRPVVVATTGFGSTEQEACEDGKNKLTQMYPNNVLTCDPCPPESMLHRVQECPKANPCPVCKPWSVTYTCIGSDGTTYKFTADGTSFCDAYNTAKSKLCSRLTSRGITCCQACYTIVKKPCECPTKHRLFPRLFRR